MMACRAEENEESKSNRHKSVLERGNCRERNKAVVD